MIPPPDAAIDRFRADLAGLRAGADPIFPDGAVIALAVSGGPDSMALLALAHAAHPGTVIAATFDHQLRAGSATEAAMVAGVCTRLGVPHTILHPDVAIAGSSLQARARTARYTALIRWASSHAAPLLTAHHADDQAETLLMRLNRASGVAGLSGIRPARVSGGVTVLRPLLGWRRAELRTIVEATGLPFVDDPSNHDPRHDRTRIRALLARTPELDVTALAASAAYLHDAEQAIAAAADRAWSEYWDAATDTLHALDRAPREIARRLVRRAIWAVRQRHDVLLPAFSDAANVEALLDALLSGRGAVQGGVQGMRVQDGWHFRPAPPRRSV